MNLDINLYLSILTRKSTRNFSEEVIGENVLNEIKEYIENLTPLFPEDTAKLIMKETKANTYRVYAFGDGTLMSNVNIGFILQQLDLFLQTKKIGSLWFGMGRKPNEIEDEYLSLKYAICIHFGIAKNDVSRNIAEFKRKELSKFFAVKENSIIKENDRNEIFSAVRLAPSAGNSQPVFYLCSENKIHIYCSNGELINFYKRLNQFDIGISLCHLFLAFQKTGYKIEMVKEKDIPTINKHYYVSTVLIK